MKHSSIEWCDHTFNPWEGCTKVSPGCANCYAEARNRRFAGGENWGPGAPRRLTSEANWRQPLAWNRDAAKPSPVPGKESIAAANPYWNEPRRPRVFCASLADWLDDEVPIEWLADLFDLVRRTPNLDWQLLTKRPQNWAPRVEACLRAVEASDRYILGADDDLQALRDMLADWFVLRRPPRNVWIGTTVEDQARAEERIPELLKIPARVRFLSCEPLLGPVDLDFGAPRFRTFDSYHAEIHWVICGGESGPGARSMHPDWARSLRDQCAAWGKPYFFKQWGEWLPFASLAEATEPGLSWGEDESLAVVWQSGLRGSALLGSADDAWRRGARAMRRVGKKAAGRLLDGREHSAFPEVRP